MKIIDITRTVQEAPLYPGSSPVVIERVSDMQKGAHANVSMITSGSHIGTHADAFSHFVGESDIGIDKMELSYYYGKCRVVTVPYDTLITKDMLEGKFENCERLVIHGNGRSYLTREAAQYIVDMGVITIVTDALSIAPRDNEVEIHNIILGSKIAVIENVTLEGVADGKYTLCAFPIKIGDCDGAPVRAVLIK
ncbi:MAG: cyclase family protein [Oscillospiraceae bacterium]|nr:cyclase family protein [Oscillospiraceae bacterium]